MIAAAIQDHTNSTFRRVCARARALALSKNRTVVSEFIACTLFLLAIENTSVLGAFFLSSFLSFSLCAAGDVFAFLLLFQIPDALWFTFKAKQSNNNDKIHAKPTNACCYT